MTFRGTVKNGVVVLPADAVLPEGATVAVIAEQDSPPADLLPVDHPAIAAILNLAKPRPDWPEDFALNHAHYSKGHPRKS